MKTFLIVFFVPVFLYGQAVWTPPVIIEDITVNAADKIISYSDANGNHVVINSSGTITYYRLNIEGSLETNVAIDNSCEYSNYTVAITAYQDELYIAYQKGIYIKVVKSINGGNSWANLTETNMDNNICNGIDAVYDEKGLHVVWAIKRQSDDFFETWYERYKRTEPQQWEARYNITDEAFADIGGRPTIALSENRIHVNYNIYSGYELNGPYYYNLGYIDAARTRDFNFTPNTWESSQLVFISEPSLPFPCEVDFWSSSAEKIIVHNGYLHFISFVWVFPVLGTCGIPWFFIYDKRRPIDNPNWESETVISQYCGADQNMPVVAITGQKLHTMAFFPGSQVVHFQYSNNNWSEIFIADPQLGYYPTNFCLSAYSYSLYAFWISDNNQLWYSQSAQNPSAPLEVNQLNQLLKRQYSFFNYEPDLFPDVTSYTQRSVEEFESNKVIQSKKWEGVKK